MQRPRVRTLLIGAVLLAVVAVTAGIVFLLQRDDSTKTATTELDVNRAGARCDEPGRETLEDCVEQRDTADQHGEPARHEVTVDELRVGDCVNELVYPNAIVVPCTTAHQGEIVAVLVASEGPYPGEELLIDSFAPKCEMNASTYVGGDLSNKGLYVVPEVPLNAEWDRYGRKVICSTFPTLKNLLDESVRN